MNLVGWPGVHTMRSMPTLPCSQVTARCLLTVPMCVQPVACGVLCRSHRDTTVFDSVGEVVVRIAGTVGNGAAHGVCCACHRSPGCWVSSALDGKNHKVGCQRDTIHLVIPCQVVGIWADDLPRGPGLRPVPEQESRLWTSSRPSLPTLITLSLL